MLNLSNTLTRKKEPFTPLDPSRVTMYVCGPTVYDYAHIGNARPVVAFDVLYRVLRKIYGDDHVIYARNITDIDDKIIKASQETGEPIEGLTARTADAYFDDMRALMALDPDENPRATGYIPQMIKMIEKLIEKGHAYEADGHVLFNVPSMDDYGKLSNRNRDEQIAGARVEVAPYKKDPSDFVLWKPSSDDQPGWDSPFGPNGGRGRPGWHLECSVMSGSLLGQVFDIHGGGVDLVFPHHENEIAQSRCCNGTDQMARFWVHNGYVKVNGEKMSKSLGNFITVHDLRGEAPGEAIRLVLLSAHYRQPLDFTTSGLKDAKRTLDSWYGTLRDLADVQAEDCDVPDGIWQALEDDLNTPQALAEMHALFTAANKTKDPAEQARLKGQILAGGQLMGLMTQDPAAWFAWAPETAEVDASQIDALVAARDAARAEKNFAEADRIRDELDEMGVVIEDGSEGTRWHHRI